VPHAGQSRNKAITLFKIIIESWNYILLNVPQFTVFWKSK
jgi:hypothetical protein